MNTIPLDLPWYRNGCEFMDSLRMPSAISPSMSPSSSLCGSVSSDSGVRGAIASAEGRIRAEMSTAALAGEPSDVGDDMDGGPMSDS